MTSADTPAEPPNEVDPVQEPRTPKASSTRAICLQLKATESERASSNFQVKVQIRQPISGEGSFRSALLDRFIELEVRGASFSHGRPPTDSSYR